MTEEIHNKEEIEEIEQPKNLENEKKRMEMFSSEIINAENINIFQSLTCKTNQMESQIKMYVMEMIKKIKCSSTLKK